MAETLDEFHARLHGAAISTYVAMMLVVPLKIWCRFSAGRPSHLGWDDGLAILALASANAFFYVCLLGMGPALGKHIPQEVPVPEIIGFLKYLFAGQLLYVITLAIIKYTILALYWRLFSVSTRIPILVALFIVTAWVLAEIFTVVFTCSPIHAQWDITVTESKCISLDVVYISGSTPNVVTDFIILLLPIPYLWQLHAPIAQRLILGGIFMLGCFVSVVSIIRLVILVGIPLASTDTTFNSKEVIVWSVVEINVGLISACLPSMKPALGLLRLDRLYSTINPPGRRDESKRSENQYFGGKSRNRTLAGSLFSTLTSSSRIDDEEDSHQMVTHRFVQSSPASSVLKGPTPTVGVERDTTREYTT